MLIEIKMRIINLTLQLWNVNKSVQKTSFSAYLSDVQ